MLAGFRVRLWPLNASRASALLDRFSPFLLAPEGTPDLDLEVRPDLAAPELLPGDLNITWSLKTEVLTFASQFEQASLELDRRRGVVHLAPTGDLENLLRVYIAVQCLRHGGMLLHASGVVQAGKARVFFGPSGAGKSTIARISATFGYPVLGDDVVALRRLNDIWHAFSLPFGSREGMGPLHDIRAPILGLYRLRKSAQHQLAPIPLARATAELSGAIPFVHTAQGLSDLVLAECQNLAGAIPIQELWFHPETSVWAILAAPQ